MRADTHHASCVVLGGKGVLIRGASGSGKSTLALDLIEEARRDGEAAALVADDRVILETEGGRIIARAVPELVGLIEVRGLGIVAIGAADSAALALVVDLIDHPTDRMPTPDQRATRLMDTDIALLQLQRHTPRAARIVRMALGYCVTRSPAL